jgi:biotin transport system substrate-specific component
MAICVTLLCISSFLVFPLPGTPVVISLHTVFVVLIGLLLPTLHGIYTMSVYLLMGMIGLPVLAGGTGGIGKLFGPTGGFYFGFLLAIFLISLCCRGRSSFARFFFSALVGIPIWHGLGILFACLFGGLSPLGAFFSVSLPFLLGDILKCGLAALAACTLHRHHKH